MVDKADLSLIGFVLLAILLFTIIMVEAADLTFIENETDIISYNYFNGTLGNAHYNNTYNIYFI